MNLLKFGKIYFLLSFFIILVFSNCATTTYYEFSSNKSKIALYATTKPEKPYTEVCFVEVWGNVFSSKNNMFKKLIQRGEKLDCDAFVEINYKSAYLYPTITAIGIKYK